MMYIFLKYVLQYKSRIKLMQILKFQTQKYVYWERKRNRRNDEWSCLYAVHGCRKNHRLAQFGWGTKVYVQNQSGPSNDILHHFCLTGGSTLTSQDYNPSSVVYVSKPVRAILRYLLSAFCALLCCSLSQYVQLRDPKNNFIFNFNFDDKMKNLWTVWISRKINE